MFYLRLGRLCLSSMSHSEWGFSETSYSCHILALGNVCLKWLSKDWKFDTFFEFSRTKYTSPSFRLGYMCATDYYHELGEGPTNEVYSSIDQLKKARPCVEECGILEIRVSVSKIVQRENWTINENEEPT